VGKVGALVVGNPPDAVVYQGGNIRFFLLAFYGFSLHPGGAPAGYDVVGRRPVECITGGVCPALFAGTDFLGVFPPLEGIKYFTYPGDNDIFNRIVQFHTYSLNFPDTIIYYSIINIL
jgi:hypothetical protein